MKTNKILLASCLFAIGSTLFIGCAKEDLNAPVVTLNGSDITISLQGTYTELNASAIDDEDGELTPVISGSVDVNKTGEYKITYTATDAAGNEGTAVRTVTVKNDADYLTGIYTTDEAGSPSWDQTITASETKNNRIIFGKFANYSNNTAMYATVVGNDVELYSTTVMGIGQSGCTHVFSYIPGGMSITQVGGKYKFSIKFSDEQQSGGAGCTATSAQAYEDIFTQK